MTNQPPTQDRSFEEALESAWDEYMPEDVEDISYTAFKSGWLACRTFTQAEERKRAADVVNALRYLLETYPVIFPSTGIMNAESALKAYSQAAGDET